MPNRSGTGPRGMGARTGWGLGNCNANNQPSFGFGRRRGWRYQGQATGQPGWGHRGYGPGAWASPVPQDETALLKTQAEQLQAQLDVIQQRLTELDED